MSELNLSFLGSPYIARSQKGEITFPKRKALALLAYLAVESDHSHSRESLLGLLWPELPTAAAQNNLRVVWALLRKHLNNHQDDSAPYLISTRLDLGFNLHSNHTLDVSRFLDLVAAARAHEHANLFECSECTARLAQALELVRGEFLAGFSIGDCPAFDEWLFVQRERLHLQVLDLLEELAQASEAVGHLEQATAYTRRQLEIDSLHDSAQHRLLRLLAYQGQYNNALSQYQAFKTLLNQELGIEPDAEMVLLAKQIESRSLPVPQRGQVTVKSQPRKSNNLPENLTPFFGRETELAQLSERLASPAYRLISLVGPGGIGKTRLVVETARNNLHRYLDGAFFVPLEGVAKGAEIPAAIASALDVPFGYAESPKAEILQVLRNRQVLLVVDNFEHVVEEGSGLLFEILQSAPKVVLLVTSRERLNMQTEDLFPLHGLPYPDQEDDPDPTRHASIRLFAERAHRINKTFKLTQETLIPVMHICRILEGLPLGIELTATWVREFSVEEIANSLDHDFSMLDTDLRDIPIRHRSLAAVFEHSWALLTREEQDVFPRLAVFRNGFTMDAAMDVANASKLTLSRLYYKSLIQISGSRRYTMHELLRQFALQKLQENSAAPSRLQARHSRYFLNLLAAQEERLKGEKAAQVGAALRLEIDNIRQGWRWAVETGDWDLVMQSTPGLTAFFAHYGLVVEGSQLLQMAIETIEGNMAVGTNLLPTLLTKQLSLIKWTNILDEIQPLVGRILSLTRQNPALARFEAETNIFWSYIVLEHTSDTKRARIFLDRAVLLLNSLDNSELHAQLYNEYGRNYMSNGQFDEAVAAFQQSLKLFESLGDLPGQAMTYDRLAGNYTEKYKLGPALNYGQKALQLYTQLDHRTRLGEIHHNLAQTYTLMGAYDQALIHTRLSLEMAWQQANHEIGVARATTRQAFIEDRLGKTEDAEKNYRTAVAMLRELKLNFDLSYSLLDWGDLQFRVGRIAEAEKTFEEALTINSDIEHLRMTTQSKLAMVYLAGEKKEQALTLVDEIWQSIAPSYGKSLPFPINTMVECSTVFKACSDPREGEALRMAGNVLKQTANGIDDPELREAFLNNVPVNRLLSKVLLDL